MERLLVQQHHETVLAGNGIHQVHHQLVLVVRKIRFPVDGSQLELVGCHLVMPGLERNAEPEAFHFQLAHESCDTGRNGAEIVVCELLALGGHMAHQRPAGNHQVGTRGIKVFVHQEILLLPAQEALHLVHSRIEKTADGHGGIADCLNGTLERRLVIERFAGIGDENRGDAERIFLDEDGRGRIPSRITAGLEGGADAAVGERRPVRLLLGERTAVESLDDAAAAIQRDE